MHEWMSSLRRASFRGVSFWVQSDGPDIGRRVAVHHVSGGEGVVTEDMGRRASSVYVAGYVIGESADIVGLALEAACRMPGASALVLPMDPARIVHCLSCRRARYRDRMGYIAYDLEFVEAGLGGGVFSVGIGALREVFDAGLSGAVSEFSAFLG